MRWGEVSRAAVPALFVLLAACQPREASESADEAASPPTTDTAAASPADTAPLDSRESRSDAEMEEAGSEMSDEPSDSVPVHLRQVFLVEFEDPYSEEDLSWLREQGANVMSETGARSVTVWFAPRKEHAWARDDRIAQVTPMQR